MGRKCFRFVRQCANINCKIIFRTRDSKRIYCCPECYDETIKEYNRIYQKEYRKILREGKNALLQKA